MYVDYALFLTIDEAVAWDKECGKAFDKDPRSQDTKIIEAMQQLEAKLAASR